jgi:hypothetical protein
MSRHVTRVGDGFVDKRTTTQQKAHELHQAPALNKNQAQHTVHVPPKKIKPRPFVPPKKQQKK